MPCLLRPRADKFIQKKRKEYTDPNSSQNMSRLNDDLADVHNIMRKNIQEVLNRGERVERTFLPRCCWPLLV